MSLENTMAPTREDIFCEAVAAEKRQSGFSEDMGPAPLQPPGVTEFGTGSPGAGVSTHSRLISYKQRAKRRGSERLERLF